MAKRKVKKNVSQRGPLVRVEDTKDVSMGLAIIGLILNVIFLSGLGTLIAGRSKIGIWQIALWLVGAIFVSVAYWYGLTVFYVGTPLVIAAWIWGLITGVQLIQEAR